MSVYIHNVFVMDAASSLYCFSTQNHYATNQIEMQALLSTLKRFGEYVVKDDIRHIQFDSKIFVYLDYESLTFIVEAEVPYNLGDYGNALDLIRNFLQEFAARFYWKNENEIKVWQKTNRIDIFQFSHEFEYLKISFEKELKKLFRKEAPKLWAEKIAGRLKAALF